MKRSFVSLFCSLIVAGMLSACGTTGLHPGYVMADANDAKVVADGGWSENAVAQIAIVQNPKINGGKLSAKALKEIQELSMSCQKQVAAQASGSSQAMLNGAVIGAATGGVSQGLAGGVAFPAPPGISNFTRYFTFGVIAGGVGGAVNGYVLGSYQIATAVGSCTSQFWQDMVATNPNFRGTKVISLPQGKRSGGSLPPALQQ